MDSGEKIVVHTLCASGHDVGTSSVILYPANASWVMAPGIISAICNGVKRRMA